MNTVKENNRNQLGIQNSWMRDPRYKHELGDGGGVKLEFVQNSFDLI